MFDDIAPTYDLLNHLLSFGLDIRWRRRAVRLLQPLAGATVLDIAAGSGDVSLAVLECRPRAVVAVDFADRMLEVFRKKLLDRGSSANVALVSADALHLPFVDRTFDATIVAFGIRNFADRNRSLREMRRVLKPLGQSAILELSAPSLPVASQLYEFYSSVALPTLGRIISRHSSAYRYLPASIAQFPGRSEFERQMNDAGFIDVRSRTLSLGAATIFLGRRPRDPAS